MMLSKDVLELDIFKSFEKRKVLLKDKITILGYWGDNLNFKKAEALNLNQKIYKRFLIIPYICLDHSIHRI